MKDAHGDFIAPNAIGESVRHSLVAQTGDDPVIAAGMPMPAAEPGEYHRSISLGWWLLTLAIGVLIWIALLG